MQPQTWHTECSDHGLRLDQFLSTNISEHSRTQIKAWIIQGHAKIDGVIVTEAKTRIKAEQQITFCIPNIESKENWQGQDIAIDTVFEDEHLMLIHKPAGLTMHPGAGQPDQTLANALAFHRPKLTELPRCGIVHRLDQWTSGLCVVAKTQACYQALITMMQARHIERHYRAWVHGDITLPATIETGMGRHPQKRTQQAVRSDGKVAITHYRVAKRYGGITELVLKLETGRTHQIRVHMLHQKHAIVGDPVYHMLPKRAAYPTDVLFQYIKTFPRQALHAYKLKLTHPITGKEHCWIAPLPNDLLTLEQRLSEMHCDTDHDI